MLSKSKNNPMRVYLDQNAWIALSREYYGKDPKHELRETLSSVQLAATSGQFVFPLSFNHLVEVCASGDMERRKRLARFMIEVSGKHVIVPFPIIRDQEVLEAALRRLGVNEAAFDRSRVVRQGLWNAFGLSAEVAGGAPGAAEALEAQLNSDETAIKLLSEWMSEEAGRTLRAETVREAEFFDMLRHAQLNANGRDAKRQQDIVSVAKQLLMPAAERELRHLTVDPARLRSVLLTDVDVVAFAHDVPTFDVYLSLALARDEEIGRAIDRNDLRDLGFLAAAVPYCDLVVAERYFATLAIKLGLDSRYNTRIVPSVGDLKTALETL